MTENLRYFTPDRTDFAALRAMGRTVFADTFGHLYDTEPFSNFLEKAYGPGGTMERDLGDPSVQWLVAASDDENMVGYAKLSQLKAPVPAPRLGAMELQQIYVLRPWHGHGVADRLMEWALDQARVERTPEVYLTVFDHNERAKRFYTRYGFAEVGRCNFVLGDRVDDDRVWRKKLLP
ncbi:GNAT family N-acetyltransferase [Acidomonas methanolica]|uniref:N-acetyltransferase GCN5 n=1 Tax=Acidomonas methanolica NBRC 104435 TaxID=1231351 RepID=A0A023D7B3_ACIMT|nr:GNAT family N-acetyltransferase [Acidomonas methanolica]MBU2653497.1 GNAT family N-acetyltransferase [Acidomonas methanolica]TCS25768.1 acetyltransferase (GNAT) family protein [Acidomonas methanolica]GAJ30048.1 N-acetyltransferase GCN5 [Acidomonas methanolica NBRC 104435]GBQ47852.1 histone acetyltransferase HPA2 [Acidomonas methanolica]GEK99378.1 N-acetyltransferase [Acidomonas methanolica NBRC 104435]